MHDTAKLAAFVADLKYTDLPPTVVHTAKLCLLDTLGVGLFASQMAWTKIVAQIGDIAHSKGTSENPMTEEEITGKFLLLAGRRLPLKRCHEVATAVGRLEQVADVCEFTELLRTTE